GAGDGLARGLRLARIEASQLHQARPTENRVEWRPQLLTQRLQKFVLQSSGALGFDTRRALEFEQGPQLIEGLSHESEIPIESYPFPRTLPFIRSQRGEHAVTDNIAPPTAQHTDFVVTVSEQLEVTPGGQHLGTQTEICRDGLVKGGQFLHQGGLRRIGPRARVDRWRWLRNAGLPNAIK